MTLPLPLLSSTSALLPPCLSVLVGMALLLPPLPRPVPPPTMMPAFMAPGGLCGTMSPVGFPPSPPSLPSTPLPPALTSPSARRSVPPSPALQLRVSLSPHILSSRSSPPPALFPRSIPASWMALLALHRRLAPPLLPMSVPTPPARTVSYMALRSFTREHYHMPFRLPLLPSLCETSSPCLSPPSPPLPVSIFPSPRWRAKGRIGI